MNSQEFIINKINHLIELFPEIHIQYTCDATEGSHFIAVFPKEIYNSNERYANEELILIHEFIKKYPYELITFITEDDLVKIENPIYEKKGFLYNWYQKTRAFNFAQITIFEYLTPVLPNKISLEISLKDKFISDFRDINFSDKADNESILIHVSDSSPKMDIPVGESRFAMAA